MRTVKVDTATRRELETLRRLAAARREDSMRARLRRMMKTSPLEAIEEAAALVD